MARAAAAVDRPIVEGVSISHADRVLFPAAAGTKLDLARYYAAMASWMVPHVVDRPLTLVHCPKGVPRGGARKGVDCVFMKHAKVWGPTALRRVRIREKTKVGEYLIADSATALVGLAQMDVLEIHTWNSRFADVERPDRIVIDLDPGERVSWPDVVDAARLVRSLLRVLDLRCFVKTTGGRGLHVVVPLEPSADWSACLEFARAFALSLVRRKPATFTERFAKLGREDRILVDYLRNAEGATAIAPYSLRAKKNAPVSMPIAWDELKRDVRFDCFNVRNAAARLKKQKRDPWAEFLDVEQAITPQMMRSVGMKA